MSRKQIGKTAGLIAVCVAVGVFLHSHRYAAGNDWSIQAETESVQQEEFPERYQKEVDSSLTFDVEVDAGGVDAAAGFLMATAERREMDQEKLRTYFLDGQDEAVQTVYENYLDADGFRTTLTEYENEEISLDLSKYDFTFVRNVPMKYIWNAFYPDAGAVEYNAGRYSLESDLEFMERSSAWTSVKETLEALGISMSDAVSRSVYSLDQETLQAEELCLDVYGNPAEEEKNPQWSKADEGYLYYITQSWQGIPFYAGSGISEDSETDTPLTLYQTGNGIAYVSLTRWFRTEGQERTVSFADFETIMNVLEEKYSGMLHTNPLTVERARLYIIPVEMDTEGIYALEPVWLCTLAEKHVDAGEDAYVSYEYIPIHAVTGEEMLTLEN